MTPPEIVDEVATRPRTPRMEEVTGTSASPAVAWWRTAVIGAVAFAGALALLAGLWLFARPLALLFGAIAIAQALAPAANRLAGWLPRALAVTLMYVVLVLALVGLGWFAAPQLVMQAERLAENVPFLFERGRDVVTQWNPDGEERLFEAAEGLVGRVSRALIQLPMMVFSAVAEIALVLFLSAYWLISAPRLLGWIRSLLPPARADRIHAVLTECGDAIGGYVRGEAISAAIIGTISFVGLSVIGVDYVLVLALLAALGEIVPVVGPIIAAGPAVAVALLDSTEQAAIVLGFYIVIQQFESNILIPQIMRHQAHIPPVLALLALFAGVGVGGILGALIAIPMAAALKVLVLRVAAPAIRRWTGADRETPAAAEA